MELLVSLIFAINCLLLIYLTILSVLESIEHKKYMIECDKRIARLDQTEKVLEEVEKRVGLVGQKHYKCPKCNQSFFSHTPNQRCPRCDFGLA